MLNAQNLSSVTVSKAAKKSLRQQEGFINTVASQLTMYKDQKGAFHKLTLLKKCEANLSTYLEAQSLVLWAQEVQAFGVKHEAQRLVNMLGKALKGQEVLV